MFIEPTLDGILSVIALLWITIQLFKLGRFVYHSFVAPITLSCYRRQETGSDGIGLGFAKQLAGQGFNVLITGRNQEKLERVRDQIQQCNQNVQIEYILSNAEDQH